MEKKAEEECNISGENYNFERKEADTHDIDLNIYEDRFPTKTLLISVLFFITGISLLIAGLVEEFVDEDPTKGMAMWIVGIIVFIPGFYYTFLFVKALRCKNINERLKILREIPEF